MPEQNKYIKTVDDASGSVNISEDVISAVAATAASEVEGVHSLYYSPNKEISSKISRKGIAKSIKLSIEDDEITVDVFILLAKTYSANDVGIEVQKSIISAVQDAVGVSLKAVNVHICGVVLKTRPMPRAD